MHESIYKYMKVGLVHFMAYPVASGDGPILETLKKILIDDYFDAVEVAWIKDAAVRREAVKMLETSHVTVAYGAHPRLLSTGLNVNDLDDRGREQALVSLKEGIDEAYEMGARGYAFLSGKYDKNRQEEAFEALVESTMQLCEYAKTKGSMKVIHEMFDHEIDKKSLIGPAALARRYAERIKAEYDNFGLLVDLGHIPLIKESPEEAILPVKEYLVHAHLGNCIKSDPALPGYGDTHPRFAARGSENDIEQVVNFLRVLWDIGFLDPVNPPIVSFEIKPLPGEDPDIVVANAKRTLTEAWARL